MSALTASAAAREAREAAAWAELTARFPQLEGAVLVPWLNAAGWLCLYADLQPGRVNRLALIRDVAAAFGVEVLRQPEEGPHGCTALSVSCEVDLAGASVILTAVACPCAALEPVAEIEVPSAAEVPAGPVPVTLEGLAGRSVIVAAGADSVRPSRPYRLRVTSAVRMWDADDGGPMVSLGGVLEHMDGTPSAKRHPFNYRAAHVPPSGLEYAKSSSDKEMMGA